MAILHFVPTYMSASDDHGVGNKFTSNSGITYKWVEFVDVDTLANSVVYPANTTGTQVTMDFTGGSGLSAKVVGITPNIQDISAKQYGFIQTSGVATVIGDGSVAAGEAVIGHSVNGQADTMADGEEELVFGFALAADATNGTSVVFACYLNDL